MSTTDNINSNKKSTTILIDDDDGIDEDWEEWDGRSPFWAHCVAGSMAGLMEHASLYPLDTVRTHIQVCAGCVVPKNNSKIPSHKFTAAESSTLLRSTSSSHHPPRLPLGMWQTIRHLVSEPTMAATVTTAMPPRSIPSTFSSSSAGLVNQMYAGAAGWTRLFRGVQAMFIGCIPAHALYFSSYEITKAAFTSPETGNVSTVGSSLAGAAAVTAHDLIMTPLDTLKQRLQLGHYKGVGQAIGQVYQQEGVIALYRSFPITLLTNVPYGMIMVSTHEACKKLLREQDNDRPAWQIVLAASSVAGFVASGATTPLDRIKTALQTQQLAPVCPVRARQASKMSGGNNTFCLFAGAAAKQLKHANWRQAATTIYKEEGLKGFVRGMTPRILSHTPAVAISWTTYETAKQYLLQHF